MKNITIDGKEYVLIPRSRWEAIERRSTAKRSSNSASTPESYTIDDVRLSLARKVTAARKSAGFTQAQLAKLAHVRVETISRLENGKHMPSTRIFDKLERALAKASKSRAA